MRARPLLLPLLVVALTLSLRAGAQSADGAAAQALYDAAGELMDAKRWDEACPKLEEALRLAPAAVGAKLRLAQCFEGQQRLASAWSMFLAAESAARAAGQADRAQKAHDGATSLEPRLSKLTIVVPQATRALSGLAIERDGAPVGPGQWSVAIPVDGGTHKVVALAAGKAQWERAVVLAAEGSSATVEVGPLAEQAGPAATVGPLPTGSPTAEPRVPPASSAEGGAPVWVWIAGAGGIALGAGAVGFAVDLKSVADRQVELCGPRIDHCERAPTPYDPAADNERKTRDYALGLVFGGAGVALVAAGVIGLVLAPPKAAARATTGPRAAPPGARVTPRVWASASGGGVALSGTFE